MLGRLLGWLFPREAPRAVLPNVACHGAIQAHPIVLRCMRRRGHRPPCMNSPGPIPDQYTDPVWDRSVFLHKQTERWVPAEEAFQDLKCGESYSEKLRWDSLSLHGMKQCRAHWNHTGFCRDQQENIMTLKEWVHKHYDRDWGYSLTDLRESIYSLDLKDPDSKLLYSKVYRLTDELGDIRDQLEELLEGEPNDT